MLKKNKSPVSFAIIIFIFTSLLRNPQEKNEFSRIISRKCLMTGNLNKQSILPHTLEMNENNERTTEQEQEHEQQQEEEQEQEQTEQEYNQEDNFDIDDFSYITENLLQLEIQILDDHFTGDFSHVFLRHFIVYNCCLIFVVCFFVVFDFLFVFLVCSSK